MKALLLIPLLVLPLVTFGRDAPYSDETWLREGFVPKIAKFDRYTLIPHPEHNGIIAANCETDVSWWGRLRVFHNGEDNKLDWIAAFPKEYTENCGHYIISCRWYYLQKLQMWVLEVFDSTHMGNGSLWLFTLEEREFRLLLHTTARGHFLKAPADLIVPPFGHTLLVEDHLKIDYRTPSGAATDTEAVFLSGTIKAVDQEDKELGTKPYAESWRWNADTHVFTRVQP